MEGSDDTSTGDAAGWCWEYESCECNQSLVDFEGNTDKLIGLGSKFVVSKECWELISIGNQFLDSKQYRYELEKEENFEILLNSK